MLAEVEDRYKSQGGLRLRRLITALDEREYDLAYLDNPRDALEEMDDTAELWTVVNENLWNYDPVAYAFLEALTLTEEQVNDLQDKINERWATRSWAPGSGGRTTATSYSSGLTPPSRSGSLEVVISNPHPPLRNLARPR